MTQTTMQQDSTQDQSAAGQLRPVVITVVTLKLMVFALLMTTLNVPAPSYTPVEIAALR